jgi:hypothetical protein
MNLNLIIKKVLNEEFNLSLYLYEDTYGSVEKTDFISDDYFLNEAEYQGRKVQLGNIMQGYIKKFKVYVKNDKGKVVKVNFGFGGKSAKGKRMPIKKIIRKEENLSEQDIIVIILDQDGNQDIGLVELGNYLSYLLRAFSVMKTKSEYLNDSRFFELV